MPVLDAYAALFAPERGLKGLATDFKPSWRTPRAALGPDDIVNAFQSWQTAKPWFIGLRFGPRTRHGVIDLDRDSPYRSLTWWHRLRAAAESLDLQLTLTQSSHSGGWHVLLTVSDWISAEAMGRALEALCRQAGIPDFAMGHCELYPHASTLNKGLRLPGQHGWGLLDDEGILTYQADGRHPAPTLSRVHLLFKAHANDPETVLRASETLVTPLRTVTPVPAASGRSWRFQEGVLPEPAELKLLAKLVRGYDKKSMRIGRPAFHDPANPYGLNQYLKGQDLYRTGLQEASSRNEALRAVGFYLSFSGLTDPMERAAVLELWLQERHQGQSKDWLRRKEAVLKEIRRMAFWAKPDAEDTASKVIALDPYQRANKRRQAHAREKILLAVQRLHERNMPVTYKNIQSVIRISSRTLAKHHAELGPDWGIPKETIETPKRDHRVKWGASKQAATPFGAPPEVPRDLRPRREAPGGVVQLRLLE